MNKRRTENERRLLNTVHSVITFSSLLFLLAYVTLTFLSSKDILSKSSAILLIVIVVIIQIFIFILRTGWILKKAFNLIANGFFKSQLVGRWTIIIEYTNGNQRIQRTGTLKISESYLGLNISGGSLYDAQTKITEVQNWESRYADAFIYEGKRIFFYQYITYEKGDLSDPTKTGVVNLKEKNHTMYTGVFRDFEVDGTKVIRSGDVSLIRIPD